MLNRGDNSLPKVAQNRVARVLRGATSIPIGDELPKPRRVEVQEAGTKEEEPPAPQMQTIWKEWMALSERMASMMATLSGQKEDTDASSQESAESAKSPEKKKIHTPLSESQFKPISLAPQPRMEREGQSLNADGPSHR